MKKKLGYKADKEEAKEEQAENSEVKSALNKEGETVTIRKITNGFIASTSYYEGEGNKKEWKSKETYYEKNPL
jgi:hypothetical protein